MVSPLVAAAGISAAGNLAGSLVNGGSSGPSFSYKDTRQAAEASIRGRVRAARQEGISPLYALGAPVMSVERQVGDSGLGQSLSNMGQDISRAVAAGQTSVERQLQDLTLLKAKKEIEHLDAQTASILARTARESGPAFPGKIVEEITPPTRTPGAKVFGMDWEFSPNTSDLGQIGENRAGELLGSLYGVPAVMDDIWWNSALRRGLLDMQKTAPNARSAFDYIVGR